MPTFEEIRGKTLLAGVNFYDKSHKLKDRKQYFGTVIAAGVMGIRIRCRDGKEVNLPPKPDAIFPAEKRSYGLFATGEIIKNPDFITVWDVEIQDKNNSEGNT